MGYEVIIGLEVHAQLQTKSKMFCSCSADYASTPPNTHVCPVCLGMPGVLPVINKKAIEFTVMTALALHCEIAKYAKFDRKNYTYPDLMKGYQISQYDYPIGKGGWLEINTDGVTRKIGITRVHLEEDVAKLFHRVAPDGETYSLVDVNRSGVPLMEIVGEPDIRSAEEARQYLIKQRSILQHIGVSSGNMQEGSFRCDANISIRPEGTTALMPKVEVKNMNSFKAVYRAMEYEAVRQQKVIEEGAKLVQETRGWMDEKGITVSQRSKEYAHDYRYFPEPDLPPLSFDMAWIREIAERLPELPDAKKERFAREHGLSDYDASLLTATRSLADYYESCVKMFSGQKEGQEHLKKAKELGNWILGDMTRLLNAGNMEIQDSKISPQMMTGFLNLIEAGELGGPAAKTVFQEMFDTGNAAGSVMVEKGLSQITDTDEIRKAAKLIISQNTKAVADFKSGKEQALTFLVGQLMRATKGRAQAAAGRDILMSEIGDK